MDDIIIVTSDDIPGYEVVEVFGVVRGNTVRARAIGRDILASLRGVVGGEITEYTQLIAQAREQSIDRMKEHAESLGANAITCTRFTTSSMMNMGAELLAFGTAVKVRKL